MIQEHREQLKQFKGLLNRVSKTSKLEVEPHEELEAETPSRLPRSRSYHSFFDDGQYKPSRLHTSLDSTDSSSFSPTI